MSLSKYLATKGKARIANPLMQHFSLFSAALVLVAAEQGHLPVALHKTKTKAAKTTLQRPA
ncbi:hypothetical protein [Shewanella sp.]|uniref:hypothetical protein n=1 Tax=Shewanella sp. TaxID=50422 RepID=UPI00356651AC